MKGALQVFCKVFDLTTNSLSPSIPDLLSTGALLWPLYLVDLRNAGALAPSRQDRRVFITVSVREREIERELLLLLLLNCDSNSAVVLACESSLEGLTLRVPRGR